MTELQQRLGAQGDFAQAYIIAHEIGHHVQNLLGVMDDVNLRAAGESRRRQRALRPPRAAGRLPRRDLGALRGPQQELLETGDLEEALNAAAAVGDDRIQKKAGQGSIPDTFTHGTGEQRVTWFKNGFQSGDPTACDTFKGNV